MKTIITATITATIIFLFTSTIHAREKVTITSDGNDVVVLKPVEVDRIKNVYKKVSPKEVLPEIAYQLTTGELKSYVVSEKKEKITSFFPIRLQTNVTYVAFDGKFLVKKYKKGTSGDWLLTFFWIIVPIILLFIFTQYFCVNNAEMKHDWRLALFYASIFTGIFAGGIIGINETTTGMIAGFFFGGIAGGFAGELAGGLTGGITGVLIAGWLVGMFTGDLTGGLSWQNAGLTQYIIILLVACITSYAIGNIIRMVRTILKN